MGIQSPPANRYLAEGSTAAELFRSAQNYLPGGNTRQSVWSSPRPTYARKGAGCRVIDADGQERIDFVNNYTSLIHGHAHPKIVAAVSERLADGTAFGLPTPYEIDLAKLLCERVPTIERVRFTNSGTESVMMAIKVARAYTGRHKIAKVEGCYHGAYDPVEVSQAPTPDNWGSDDAPASVPFYRAQPGSDDVVVLPFNDPDAAERLITRHANELATVVIDPLPSRAGLIPATPEFLHRVREVTRAHGIVLFFDEVMSFRLAYGGAQTLFDCAPDLTTIAKIIGGGFPVGAVGGTTEIMDLFSPTARGPRVVHAGTFNGNPVTAIAGLTAMELMIPSEYDRLSRLGDRVRQELNALFESKSLDWQVTGRSNMFRLHPSRRPLRNYRDAYRNAEETRRGAGLYHALMAGGVMLTPDGMGNISTPMGDAEIDSLLNAVEAATRDAAAG